MVAREVSRLGRKTDEVLMLMDIFKDKGIKLVVDNLVGLDLTVSDRSVSIHLADRLSGDGA